MTSSRDHWQQVYADKAVTDVSWYQRDPAVSLRLIESFGSGPTERSGSLSDRPVIDRSLIDIGGGASVLVDTLVDAGWRDVTVLDVSDTALDHVRARLGDRADRVVFLVDDVLSWRPDRRYDVWHDRAVFHFLTVAGDRNHYVELAARAVAPGGIVVLGTFAEDGPEQCSGLPVCRYSTDELAEVFAPSFDDVHHEREIHRTPGGATQTFSWVVLRRP